MAHVRVRSTVSTTLNKRKVISILDRLGKFLDFLGQQMCIIRDLNYLGNFGLRFLAVCKICPPPSFNSHSKLFLLPYTSILSRY